MCRYTEPGQSSIYSKCQLRPRLSIIISWLCETNPLLIEKEQKRKKMIFSWTFRTVFRMSSPPCGRLQILLPSLTLIENSRRGRLFSILSPLFWSHLVDLDDYGYFNSWLLSSIYKSTLIRLYSASYESNKIINGLRPKHQNTIEDIQCLNMLGRLEI